jgi:hypothetical protein
MHDSMWNLPSPINRTVPLTSSLDSPSGGTGSITGDVHPNTSPLLLGFVYGKIIFV